MPETQVQPEQGEEREPWDYQPEGGGGPGGELGDAQLPPSDQGGGEGGQLEQTSPAGAEEGGGGEGESSQGFAPWIEILIEVGVVLLKKAQDQGIIKTGQIREITERHGILP
jgi:hypothetical protein